MKLKLVSRREEIVTGLVYAALFVATISTTVGQL